MLNFTSHKGNVNHHSEITTSHLLELLLSNWKLLSRVRLFATPWTILQSMEFSRPGYWVGSLSLLQGIFPTQGSNLGLPHCRQILCQLSHKGSQEYWSGWPIPSAVDLPDPGIKVGSPASQVDSLPTELSGKPYCFLCVCMCLSLLQGIFPIRRLNPHLPHCRWLLYQLIHKGSQEYWTG